MTRVFRSTGLRFVLVGGVSFLIDAGTLFILHGLLGMWLGPATALAFGTAFFANFALNRMWVFSATGDAGRHFLRYASLVLANLVLTVLLVKGVTWLVTPHFGDNAYLVAKAVSTGSLFITNYVISKRWIYTSSPVTAAEAEL